MSTFLLEDKKNSNIKSQLDMLQFKDLRREREREEETIQD